MKAMTMCLILTLMVHVSRVSSADTCVDEPEDGQVYLFADSGEFRPYAFRDEDGEPAGIFVDVVKMICGIMNKKCKHIIAPFRFCWNNANFSVGLNNRWWDVCLGMIQIAERRSSMGFVAEFVPEPEGFIYVKKGSTIKTVDEIKSLAVVRGWWITANCIERNFGTSFAGRVNNSYSAYSEMADAVDSGEIEAMVAYRGASVNDDIFVRLDTEPIHCALGGFSMMVRKDMVHELAWMDEGLKKLRENGDYRWMCNKVKQRIGFNPGC